jgi:hypothetical protein
MFDPSGLSSSKLKIKINLGSQVGWTRKMAHLERAAVEKKLIILGKFLSKQNLFL